MSFFIIILAFLLVVTCGVLVLLILVQLPKKDAGAGLAFGGGAADALFGAGSGNALTKITKWVAGVFVGLVVILSICQSRMHTGGKSDLDNMIQQDQQTPAVPSFAPQTTPKPAPQTAPPSGATPAPLVLPSSTNAQPPASTSGK